MKVANIIGKIIMVVFGLGSLSWIASMLGLFGMDFWIEDLSKVFTCIVCFIIGIVVTVSTSKKSKKK